MAVTAQHGLAQRPDHAETVALNGSKIYYERYGTGTPLFFFHGYTQSSISWHGLVRHYADEYSVYLVDLKGHGRSGMFTETLSVWAVAEEVAALIAHLGLEEILAIGYSYGGEVLFQLALLRPELVRSMVVIGSCGSWEANDFPQVVEFFQYGNIENMPWMHEQQTSDAQIRAILDQLENYAIAVSDEELRSITTRTLLVLGDRDEMIHFDCVLRAMAQMPDVSLWVVPKTGHRAHRNMNEDDFVRLSRTFFARTALFGD